MINNNLFKKIIITPAPYNNLLNNKKNLILKTQDKEIAFNIIHKKQLFLILNILFHLILIIYRNIILNFQRQIKLDKIWKKLVLT
jgi:hypothetical protein